MTKPSKPKAIERLRKAITEIPELKNSPRFSPEFEKWHRNTEIAVEYTFGKEGRHVDDFTNIGYSLIVFSGNTPDYKFQQRYEEGLESAAKVLESMIEEIEEYWEDEDVTQHPGSPQRDVQIDTNRVFLVHGRDDGIRHTVARVIEQLGLKAVILEEQPNQGRTVIEKFEEEAAEVGFSVVLLTPDDEGRLKGEDIELSPRARQNAVFELGYFAASLGRNRVCALRKDIVEIPSDYQGVIYISMDDNGGWKFKLAKELQAAGYDVDANEIL